MRNSSYFRLAVLIALFIFFIELPVFIGVDRFCFNNYDLGIYSQAIRHLSWDDPNPWLSGRQVRLWNDHFEPVLWAPAPFAKIFRPDRVAVFAELLMVLLSLAPLVVLEMKGITVEGSSVLLGALILFARPMVRALGFPVHPSTWSVLPLSLLSVSVILDRKKWIFVSLTLLFLFREEFPFLGIVVGIVFCTMRQWRFGIFVFVWSSIWGVFDFVLRPMMVGPTEGYGVGLIRTMLSHPGAILESYLDPTLFRRLLEYVVPLIPIWLWMRRENVRPNVVILSFLFSVVAIRFLSVKWYFHYGPPVVAPLVLACLPAVTTGGRKTIPKWVLRSSLAILLAVNGGELARNIGRIFGSGPEYCQGTPERLQAVKRGMDFLSNRAGGRVLVQGNLLPALTARGEIYHLGGEQPDDRLEDPYRYVFVEKPPRGDPWPLEHERIEELIGIWKGRESTRVHLDDAYVFLAEGRFVTYE